MKLSDWLAENIEKLSNSDIPTARLDALVLLQDEMDKDKSWLLAHPEHELSDDQITKLDSLIERRAKHEPLAYIRGRSEFYGREFIVTPDTLQPRAETETIIDLLHDLIGNRRETIDEKLQIIDVGTGSGCIAITAKLEFPDADVYGTEINDAALKIAQQNAKKLNADVTFYKANLLLTLRSRIKPGMTSEDKLLDPLLSIDYSLSSIILANLPYVPTNHTINQAAMQEPTVAIFGGEDGLDYYREMFQQTGVIATKLQFIITESLPFQHDALAKIAKQFGYELINTTDFIQVYKAV